MKQTKLLEIKTIMSKLKNTVDKIDSRLNIAEETHSGLKDVAIKSVQMKHREEKN